MVHDPVHLLRDGVCCHCRQYQSRAPAAAAANSSRSKWQAGFPAYASIALATAFALAWAAAPVWAGADGADASAPPAPAPLDPGAARKKLDMYVAELRETVMRQWAPPADRAIGPVTVTFRVNRDGSLEDVQISQSSGDSSADAQVASILNRLSPVKPPPAEAGDSVTVDFTLGTRRLDIEGDSDNLTSRRKAWEANPDDAKANYDYGRALRFEGDAARAIERLKRAGELGYPASAVGLELAAAYGKLGRTDLAETELKRIVGESPQTAMAHKQLGDLYFLSGRWPEAGASYKRFLELQPHGPLAELAAARVEVCSRKIQGEDGED